MSQLLTYRSQPNDHFPFTIPVRTTVALYLDRLKPHVSFNGDTVTNSHHLIIFYCDATATDHRLETKNEKQSLIKPINEYKYLSFDIVRYDTVNLK